MPKALEMHHEEDPREVLMKAAASALESFRAVPAAMVLILVYEGAEKTKSGLYIAQQTKDEYSYQGKVGLVVKTGPRAFVEDETHKFDDVKAQVGDWVLFQPGETFGFRLGTCKARIVEDVHIRGILDDPDCVGVHQ